jgi:hypothetical protein
MSDFADEKPVETKVDVTWHTRSRLPFIPEVRFFPLKRVDDDLIARDTLRQKFLFESGGDRLYLSRFVDDTLVSKMLVSTAVPPRMSVRSTQFSPA